MLTASIVKLISGKLTNNLRAVRCDEDGNLKTILTGSESGHSQTVTITRPADTTPYTANDAMGDTNGSAILAFAGLAKSGGGEVMITSIEMQMDISGVISGMSTYYLHLYNAAPAAIADNAAWDFATADRGKYLGRIPLFGLVDLGGTLFADNDKINKQIKLPGTTLYAVLQTVGGFTPASGAVTKVTIHTVDV